MNYIKRTDTMDIYIEPKRKTIVVRQRWKYNWLNDRNTSPWTYMERRDWHNKADSIIWNQWGNKFIMLAVVLEPTDANKYLHRMEFNLEFDIQWVTSNEHWTVNVTKVKPGKKLMSGTKLNKITNENTIYLEYNDLKLKYTDLGNHQTTLKHEFGHTIYVDDEYGEDYGQDFDGPYVEDRHALMNLGNELRARYIYDLKNIINDQFISGVQFTSILK